MILRIFIVTGTEESIRQADKQNTNAKDSSSSGSINGGLIGGVVAAVVLAIIIGAVIVVFIVKRRKGVYIILLFIERLLKVSRLIPYLRFT